MLLIIKLHYSINMIAKNHQKGCLSNLLKKTEFTRIILLVFFNIKELARLMLVSKSFRNCIDPKNKLKFQINNIFNYYTS